MRPHEDKNVLKTWKRWKGETEKRVVEDEQGRKKTFASFTIQFSKD